jgi:hypothetical protein
MHPHMCVYLCIRVCMCVHSYTTDTITKQHNRKQRDGNTTCIHGMFLFRLTKYDHASLSKTEKTKSTTMSWVQPVRRTGSDLIWLQAQSFHQRTQLLRWNGSSLVLIHLMCGIIKLDFTHHRRLPRIYWFRGLWLGQYSRGWKVPWIRGAPQAAWRINNKLGCRTAPLWKCSSLPCSDGMAESRKLATRLFQQENEVRGFRWCFDDLVQSEPSRPKTHS